MRTRMILLCLFLVAVAIAWPNPRETTLGPLEEVGLSNVLRGFLLVEECTWNDLMEYPTSPSLITWMPVRQNMMHIVRVNPIHDIQMPGYAFGEFVDTNSYAFYARIKLEETP